MIVCGAILIADFRRQFWSAEGVLLRFQRIRHVTPHTGDRNVRAGQNGKNHCRFAGLCNAWQTDNQRSFYAWSGRLRDGDGRGAVGIGCAVILCCGRGKFRAIDAHRAGVIDNILAIPCVFPFDNKGKISCWVTLAVFGGHR